MNTEKNYHAFLLLLTGDEALSQQLAAELVECDTDPEGFFNKHKEEHFGNRGINAPGHEEQTLCYLLDVLEDADYVCELDWKVDHEELNYAIQQMSRGQVAEDLVSEEDEEDVDGMFELIEIAEDALEEKGYGLIEFPLESDSHPLALVPKGKKEKLEKMMYGLF